MKKGNQGFTLIELLIVVAIIGIIAAIAVPGLLRARMSGNEASAIGSLRAVNSAQSTYASSCAQGFYAIAWVNLQGPGGVVQPFLTVDLTAAPNQKSGFQFTLASNGGAASAAAADCNATAGNMEATYYSSGAPLNPNGTGTRAFATNQAGTIWQDTAGGGAAAPAEPFAAAGTISPIQ